MSEVLTRPIARHVTAENFHAIHELAGKDNKVMRFAVWRVVGIFLCAALFTGVPMSSAQTPPASFLTSTGDGNMDQGASHTLNPQSINSSTTSDQTRMPNQPKNEDLQQTEEKPWKQDSLPVEISEFQRFVATSTGRLLPIFGHSDFSRPPTTFAPVTLVPVTADYVIGPEDVILLRVWGQQDFDYRLTVDRNGNIFIPQVGTVSVAGLQFRQLSDFLKSQLNRVFRNFDLSVNMGQLRSIQVYVAGKVRQPGMYTVSSLSTMVNALFASGGPLPQGSMRRIQLKRGDTLITELDLYSLLLHGDKAGDVRLQPEDVIYVPTVGSQVAVSGSLKNPAIYEIKNEKTIGEVIQMAGGLSPVANTEHATIERIKRGVSREIVELKLDDAGMEAPVLDGDLLQVLAIVPRFDNVVTLRGNVANSRRFAWKPGMRLRDIIPDKESLISRDYWQKKNLLGNPPNEKRRLWDENIENVKDRNDLTSDNSLQVEKAPLDLDYFIKRDLEAKLTPDERIKIELEADAASVPKRTVVGNTVPDINWSYAVIERQNPADLLLNLISFDLGKLVLEQDERQNLELRSGDVVTIFSQSDIRVPQQQQTRMIQLEGEFNAPGIYTVEPGETLGQIIRRAGGLTPQAYLYGAEFTRESTRSDQQKRLDKYIMEQREEVEVASRNRLANASDSTEMTLLNTEIENQKQAMQRLQTVRSTGRIVLSLQPNSNDSSQIAEMTLENGDRFVVPARPSVINVIGEVYNSNSFIYMEKRQVKEYLHLAGGFTRNADEDRMYIIRADGSLVPKRNTSKFEKLELNPGDSLVVPEHLFKTTFLRELRNWSQVVSQFGLGVAAINVLR